MGRAREFDSDEALERALAVFWKKGYEATSVQDLVTATGVNRGSLYATFGNKQKLFRKVMESYGATRSVVQTTLGLPPGLERIRAALEGAGDEAASDPRGCLVVNSIVERGAQDRGMRTQGKKAREQLDGFFAECLVAGERRGQIRRGQDLPLLARVLTNTLFGLRVMAKTLAEKDEVRALVAYTLKRIE